ncbi:MAG TPA: hypothetical protein VJA46_06525 [Acidimicrobiia bacterium]|nr:hypothetical protein [Acidimicrobiia bacterium]
MSRFDPGRWNRILIWTGAALAWGTAIIVSWLEPAREVDASQPEPAVTVDSSLQAIMPRPAPMGLVILRYTPVDAPPAEVRTVLVERAAGGGNNGSGGGGGSTSQAAPSAQAAPAPASSGS